MKKLWSRVAIVWIILAVFLGCSPKATSYVRDDVDYSFISTVAIFPFKNLSQDVNANERVRSIFAAQVLERQAVAVIEYGTVLSAMSQMKLDVNSVLTPEQIIELGTIMSVDGIFFGTVEEYGLERLSKDRTYAVTASYSLAETQTGTMIWTAQTSNNGGSFWRKLFGGGSANLYSVSKSNVNNALETLF